MKTTFPINTKPFNGSRQQGWTIWSLLFSIAVVMFFAYVGMKLVPVYSSNNNIKNAMEVAFENSGSVRSLQRSEYINKLNRQLYLDGTHKLIDFKKELTFTKAKNNVTARVDYFREVPLFFNISLKVDFINEVTKTF